MIGSVAVALLQVVLSAQLTVGDDGEELTIPVDPTSGVTIQLPEVVRVVTPTVNWDIQPLAAAPAPPAAGARPQAGGAPTDVRVFLVTPRGKARAQKVTFVLADSRSVSVQFIPGSAREDSFVDIRWARRRGTVEAGRGRSSDKFLAQEQSLLLTMLRDDPAAGRKVLNEIVELPDYPELEVALLRSYQADGLVGAVYTFRNRSDRALTINQTVLAMGKPNRAVLIQMDHPELRSCSEDNSMEPRGTGCMSAVRIVARAAANGGVDSLGVIRHGAMPFVTGPRKEGEKR